MSSSLRLFNPSKLLRLIAGGNHAVWGHPVVRTKLYSRMVDENFSMPIIKPQLKHTNLGCHFV